MNSNIKKFDSKEAFDAYRATDGWAYPSVNYITNNEESSIHYNNEFIMEWSDGDVSKTPSFYGDLSHDWFKNWVDGASKPCEIKKDGTDFAYIKMSGNNVADWSLREGDTASHYDTNDKENYFQMTEIENVNVGLFKDTSKGTFQVRFNFDKGCPEGFHKWFPNATNGKKLFGRYDIAPITACSSAGTEGILCCKSSSQGNGSDTGTTYTKGNWRASYMFNGINYHNTNMDATPKAAGYKFMELTYWEHLVMSYIFCAYYKTFDSQSVFKGFASNYDSGGNGNYTAGKDTDSILTPHGSAAASGQEASADAAYKFMHLENPLHGKQWIFGTGWVGHGTKYYMTFDDVKANAQVTFDKDQADITGIIPSMSSNYISKIDLYGVPTKADSSGTSSTGFYDGAWSDTASNSRIAYLGGDSDGGAVDGVFARNFINDASYEYWNQRGRLTMNR